MGRRGGGLSNYLPPIIFVVPIGYISTPLLVDDGWIQQMISGDHTHIRRSNVVAKRRQTVCHSLFVCCLYVCYSGVFQKVCWHALNELHLLKGYVPQIRGANGGKALGGARPLLHFKLWLRRCTGCSLNIVFFLKFFCIF